MTQTLASKRILVVEDNYILAMDICEWLREAGADVAGPVPDCARAFEELDRRSVDAAVIDINLGQGPTFEIAERLRRENVPFLFATGYDQSAIPDGFRTAPRLEKPFKGRDLIGAVRDLQPVAPEELVRANERPA